jgi:hypothetical protein
MMLKRARKKLVELLASLKPSGFHDKMVRLKFTLLCMEYCLSYSFKTAYVDQQYAEFMKRDFSDPQALFRPGAESNIVQV